jgi:threonine aldolase
VQKDTVKTILSENEDFHNGMAIILAERQIELKKVTLLPEEQTNEVGKLASKIGAAIIQFFR